MLIGIIGVALVIFNDSNKDTNSNTHVHSYTTSVVLADCLNGGREIRKCVICNKSVEKVISPKGHDYVTVEAKSALCREDGHSEYQKCIVCGYEKGKQVIEALGHNYNSEGICYYCGVAWQTEELYGTWKFNSCLTKFKKNYSIKCYFYSNGVLYSEFIFLENFFWYINYDGTLGADFYDYDAKTYNPAYSTVSFDGVQFVDTDFYNWFIANATKIQ